MLDSNGNRIPRETMLSTSDNPHNPFEDYEAWEAFDHEHHYYSDQEVATADKSSSDWPIKDQLLAFEDAVDFCVKMNLTGNRIKVTRDS